ncbi:MAG: 30S ribosomal protein S12 methylthiotransferase RimO [Tepidisphaeraceae bacterium]
MESRPSPKPSSASKKDPPIQTVAFVSLGCPKNLVDSERMLGLLAADGLAVTSDPTQADAIVINTCGFLAASKEESMREIDQAIQLKKTGNCRRVVVAGCLVQRYKTDLLAEAPGIDRLVGVFDRQHIVQAVRGKPNTAAEHGHFLGKYHDLSRRLAAQSDISPTEKETKTSRLPVFEDDRARLRLTPRHYAYLRLSEGCNQGCAFCTIPSIRGPMRSKPIDHILDEARELAADGAVELNLIGQDTTSYGTDIGQPAGLAGLLRTLDKKLPDVHWLRLMYAYPSCFTDEMVKSLADCDRVVKYIDMPLQHISDRLLALMRRRVTRKQIETLLDKLRRWVPGVTIRTTFIAGSPTETDAEHTELLKFVEDFGFDMMGVFPYSAEPGTPMGRMDGQLSDALKKERLESLMLAQQKVAFEKARQKIGSTLPIMIDSRQKDRWVGRSTGQAPDIDSVTFVESTTLHPGQIVNVKLSGSEGYDSVGRPALPSTRSLQVIA